MTVPLILGGLIVIVLTAILAIAWRLYGPSVDSLRPPTPRGERTPLVAPQPAAEAATAAIPRTTLAPSVDDHRPMPTAEVSLPPLSPELAAHIGAATAHLQHTYAAIHAVPEDLRDRVAMRAKAMTLEHELELLQTRAVQGEVLHASLTVEVERVTMRLKQLRASAQQVAADTYEWSALRMQLESETLALNAAMTELAEHPELPVVWDDTLAVSTAALSAVERIRDSPQPISHDALKRNLSRCRGLLSDIQRGRQDVQLVREQHTALRMLLARPELAADPAWYQGFQRLNTRTRQVGGPDVPPPHPAIAQLCADADAVMLQRQALFAGRPTTPAGAPMIHAAHVPALLTEAQALQRTITNLLQRARALAAERRGGINRRGE